MRQFATAWDGVGLEITGTGALLEDCVPVANGPMAELRQIAQQRQDDRYKAAQVAAGPYVAVDVASDRHPMSVLEWKTYP